jgi:hypothetical protein
LLVSRDVGISSASRDVGRCLLGHDQEEIDHDKTDRGNEIDQYVRPASERCRRTLKLGSIRLYSRILLGQLLRRRHSEVQAQQAAESFVCVRTSYSVRSQLSSVVPVSLPAAYSSMQAGVLRRSWHYFVRWSTVERMQAYARIFTEDVSLCTDFCWYLRAHMMHADSVVRCMSSEYGCLAWLLSLTTQSEFCLVRGLRDEG